MSWSDFFLFHPLIQLFQQTVILFLDQPVNFPCRGFVVGMGGQVPFLLHVQPFFRIRNQMQFPGFPDGTPGTGRFYPFIVQDGFQEFLG